MTPGQKGAAMITWAEKVQCPKEVRMNAWTVIIDTTHFLQSQVKTMKANEVGGPIWLLAYMRIYDLKQFLVTNKKKKQ